MIGGKHDDRLDRYFSNGTHSRSILTDWFCVEIFTQSDQNGADPIR